MIVYICWLLRATYVSSVFFRLCFILVHGFVRLRFLSCVSETAYWCNSVVINSVSSHWWWIFLNWHSCSYCSILNFIKMDVRSLILLVFNHLVHINWQPSSFIQIHWFSLHILIIKWCKVWRHYDSTNRIVVICTHFGWTFYSWSLNRIQITMSIHTFKKLCVLSVGHFIFQLFCIYILLWKVFFFDESSYCFIVFYISLTWSSRLIWINLYIYVIFVVN